MTLMVKWPAVKENLDAVQFHRGDVILKLMKIQGLTQKELAKRSKHGANTITKLINADVETESHVYADVLRVLDVDFAQVESLLARMNGAPSVPVASPRPNRLHNERIEDRDPDRHEAAQYALKIVRLPDVLRLAVYNVIRAMESSVSAKPATPRSDRND